MGMKKSIITICLCGILLTACGSMVDVADSTDVVSEKEVSRESVVEERTAEADYSEESSKASQEESSGETEEVVDLDEYVGKYTDGENGVEISKENGDYSMFVAFYRLTVLDEGTVMAAADRVIFDTIDASGMPMKVSFKKDGDDRFTLQIEESTWTYLNSGDTFSDFVKSDN